MKLFKGIKVNNEATLAIWEQDVGLSIDVDTWTQIWQYAGNISICNRTNV